MTNDEYKIMGLASYGRNKYKSEFRKISNHLIIFIN